MKQDIEKIKELSTKPWYIIQCLAGQEMKTCESLLNRIPLEGLESKVYAAFVPTEKVTEVRDGKKRVYEKKFYPSYIIVICDLYREDGQRDSEVWNFITNTNGVIGFLTEYPKPLPQEEVNRIIDMVSAGSESARPAIEFQLGEMVKIKEGPFENCEGKIEEIDADHSRLTVTVNIFGRLVPVVASFWDVERES